MKSIRLFLCLGSLLLWSACTDDNAVDTEQLLQGRWELVEAKRNNRPTESLTELYFLFQNDGTVETNLSGAVESGAYRLDDQTIEQRNTSMDTDYLIQSLTDSLLVLRTRLSNQNFEFSLRKAELDVQ